MGRSWGNLAQATLNHKFSESLIYHIAVEIAFHFNSFDLDTSFHGEIITEINKNRNSHSQKYKSAVGLLSPCLALHFVISFALLFVHP